MYILGKNHCASYAVDILLSPPFCLLALLIVYIIHIHAMSDLVFTISVSASSGIRYRSLNITTIFPVVSLRRQGIFVYGSVG